MHPEHGTIVVQSISVTDEAHAGPAAAQSAAGWDYVVPDVYSLRGARPGRLLTAWELEPGMVIRNAQRCML